MCFGWNLGFDSIWGVFLYMETNAGFLLSNLITGGNLLKNEALHSLKEVIHIMLDFISSTGSNKNYA